MCTASVRRFAANIESTCWSRDEQGAAISTLGPRLVPFCSSSTIACVTATHAATSAQMDAGKQNRSSLSPWHQARWFTTCITLVVACGSGGLLVLAFPPFGLWWLAPVAISLFFLCLRRCSVAMAALAGFGHGLAFFALLLHWTGAYVGAFPWLVLSSAESLYFVPLGMAVVLVSRIVFRRSGIGALVTPFLLACLWVAQEAIRGRFPWGGFPWGRLAFSQADSPLLRWAAVGGAPFVSFLVAAVGAALAGAVSWLWCHRGELATVRLVVDGTKWLQWRASTFAVPIVFTIALVAVEYLAPILVVAAPSERVATRSLRVAVVQGDVPRMGLGFNAQRRAVLDNHVNQTLNLAKAVHSGHAPQPDIVIWPENSSDIDPWTNPDAAAHIDQAARAIGAPILVGAVLNGPAGRLLNTAIVWSPGVGPTQTYTKQHPVPFAEYVPLRSVLRHITTKVDLVPHDFAPGRTSGVLHMGSALVGDVICFEVGYDALVANTMRGGTQILIVQTNNATFGKSAESAQQLAMVRLRAVEHGRYAVMASTSGISAIVSPTGRIMKESRQFVPAILSEQLRLGTERTLATAVGGWPELMLTSIAGLAVLIAIVRRYKAKYQFVRAAARPVPATPDPHRRQGVPSMTHASSDAQSVGQPAPAQENVPQLGRVLVVVPTYNEVENLPLIVDRVRRAAPDVDLLVADDKSPDGTGKIADELAATDGAIHVMHRAGKQGLGAAYIAGFRWARENGYDVVVEMDADGSHAPEQLPALLAAMAERNLDVVIGARWVPGGSVVNWPWHRKLLSRAGNVYTRLLLSFPLRDATGGFRAYRRAVLDRLDLDAVASQGYCFQVDLTWRAYQAGFQLGEVPITFTERTIGKSKMSSWIVGEALWRVTVWGTAARWHTVKRLFRRSS